VSLSGFLAENGYQASTVFVALGLDPFLVDRVDAGVQLLPRGVCERISTYTGLDLGTLVAASGGKVIAPAIGTALPSYFVVNNDGFTVLPDLPLSTPQVNAASFNPVPSPGGEQSALIVSRTVPSP